MEKLKILGMSSETYSKGRIDSFTVPLIDNSGKGISDNYLISLFKELDFAEDSVDELDLDFENMPAGTWFFVYGNPNIKAMIIIGKEEISIIFDTTLSKEEINKVIEKYFQFPKE